MQLLILTLAAVLGASVGLSASNWGGSVHDDQDNRNFIGQSRFNEDSSGHELRSAGNSRSMSDDHEDVGNSLRMGSADSRKLTGAASKRAIPIAVLESLTG